MISLFGCLTCPTLTLDLSPKLASPTGVSPSQLTAPPSRWPAKILSPPAFFSFFPTSYSMRRFYRFWLQKICSVMSDSLGPLGLLVLLGFSVHGILQARILEWVAFPPPGDRSSWLRDWTQVSSSLALVGEYFMTAPPGSDYLSLPSSTSMAQAALISHLTDCSSFFSLLCSCLCLLSCLCSFSKQKPEWFIWKVGPIRWRLKS